MSAEELKPMWYDAADLWTELKETQKVRDEWCAEYTRVRDELAALKAVIAASEFSGDIEFEMANASK